MINPIDESWEAFKETFLDGKDNIDARCTYFAGVLACHEAILKGLVTPEEVNTSIERAIANIDSYTEGLH